MPPSIYDPIVQQELIEAIGTTPLVVRCGLIRFKVALGTPYSDDNDAVSAMIPEAIRAFQDTFPDKYGFRVRLISEALKYETCHPDEVISFNSIRPC